MDEGTQVVTRKNRILFAGLALVFSCSAFADFPGKVVAVADGDTITVLRDQEQVKVRLTEIDAPEKAQAFGNQAKQALSALVFGKEVRVVDHGTDRYRRTLGRGDKGQVLTLFLALGIMPGTLMAICAVAVQQSLLLH